MKKTATLSIVAVLLAGLVIGGTGLMDKTSAEETAVQMIPQSFSTLAETARPAVVNIRTVKTVSGGGPVFRHFFGNPFEKGTPFEKFFTPPGGDRPSGEHKQRSLGSGFIVDRQGYIVTNNHVIENADQITVKLADGSEYEASVKGRDPKTDLALIKIEGSDDFKALKMGDSEALPIGGWVVAIGSPFGLEQTVTAGIVSAKGRVIGAGPYDDFIQTDASINPGNSGGPLLNMNGEVVGINTAIIASGQGIGFAIPVNMARGIVAQLKEAGEVTRGWLGVGIQDLTPELAAYYNLDRSDGALVTQVYPGDPADRGGILPGDVIVGINGQSIASGHDLTALIANLPVGKRTAVEILRKGEAKTVHVALARRDDDRTLAKTQVESGDDLGLRLVALAPEAARHFGYADDENGLLVAAVKSGSRADKAGMQRGDLIKEINRNPVGSLEDFTAQVDRAKQGEALRLLVRRANAGFMVISI